MHFHWKEYYHANERQMVSSFHLAIPVSTTPLRRWYYVNAVPTTLVLRQSGSYYFATRSLPRSLAARTCSNLAWCDGLLTVILIMIYPL